MSASDQQHRATLQTIARRAMTDRGLLPDFSAAAVAELGRVQSPVTADGPGVRDLRDLLWVSIDNDDSLDLDQLTVAMPALTPGPSPTMGEGTRRPALTPGPSPAMGEGTRKPALTPNPSPEKGEGSDSGTVVKILVAVADVDSIVKSGSAIDEHARHNTTSVYTAAMIFPMLPEKLSTDITSLKFNEDRPALVVEMVIGGDGSLQGFDVYRALVRNRAKLAYNSVAAWLEGNAAMPAAVAAVHGLDENLRLQDRMAQKMKNLRQDHGALSLETLQARSVFEGDRICRLEVDKPNRAKDLIADFMIAANGVTARYLASKKFPSIRRVVRTPKRWDAIVAVAQQHGCNLPDQPDSRSLEAFLLAQKAADPLRFPDLSLSIIKLMGPGEYVAEFPGGAVPAGHFGLAVGDYTHSTAPNRRYPDIITQRLLKAALAGQPVPYSNDDLTALATHCMEEEDAAKKVERQVEKSAAALLLESRIGEAFDAIVTGAASKGTWVRLLKLPVEGRLVAGFQGLDVGRQIRVQLTRTDVEQGFIDFKRLG